MIVAAAALAALTLQADTPSSAIERALAARTCDLMAMARGMQAPDRDKCIDDYLQSLRDDLGINLARLTPSDRQKLASACQALESDATREAYIDCVSRQLTPLRERLRKAKPAPAAAEAEAAAVDPAPPAIAPPLPPPVAPRSSRWRLVAVVGGSVVVLAAAAGAFVVMRKRQPVVSHVCRSCGTPVEDAGALCANCRHQAADALRRAAAERAAEAEQAIQRQKEAEEAAALEAVRQEEAARQAAIDEETRRREAEEAVRQRELAARRRHDEGSAPAGTAEDVDPHAILGVPKDATPDAIRAAYDAAKAKYDPENVSHLSPEVQQHYREKGEAVEKAFKMLSSI